MEEEQNNTLPEEKKKKKKKHLDKDTAAVLAILSVIVIIAVMFAFLNSGNMPEQLAGHTGKHYRKEEKVSSLGIILVSAFVAVFFIILFVIKKIRDQKRQARIRAEQAEKARKLKEIQDARERVKMAKMNEFLMAGQSELEKRKRDEAMLSRTRNRGYQEEDRFRETGGYMRRDLNAYKEDLADEELPGYTSGQKESFFQKIFRILRKLFSGKRN